MGEKEVVVGVGRKTEDRDSMGIREEKERGRDQEEK